MRRTLVVLLLVLGACGGGDDDGGGEAGDAGGGEADAACAPDCPPTVCSDDDDCDGEVCDTEAGTCVECTADKTEACEGTTPLCGADSTCESCTAHAQCTDSNACLPTGACGEEAMVAYVSSSGDDEGPCSKEEPCAQLSVAATKGRPYVKVEDDLDEAVSLVDVDVTILADPGTVITRSTSAGHVIDVAGSSDVALYDVVVRDGLGTTGIGIHATGEVTLRLERVRVINNGGYGIYMQGGEIAISRTIVSGNDGGGANLSATFDVTNSLFVANGSPTVTTGGLMLTPQTNDSVFRFNTVAHNVSSEPSSSVTDMNCAFAFASSSILFDSDKVSSNCTFEYSLFPAGTEVSGTNETGDAAFKDTDASSPFSADYFRIGETSAAIDAGEPAGAVTIDLDGGSRPQGDGHDIGADEAG